MTLHELAKHLDDLIRTDLQNLRDVYFACLIASTIAVFIGVCLEEAEAMLGGTTKWAKRLARTGWLLIVIGVAGEGIFEVYVSRTDGILGEFNNILLIAAEREAEIAEASSATAEQRASEARLLASHNEKEAAQLRKEAEAEKLERVRLEALVAPRSLTLDQQKQISSALEKFAGHTVVVSSYGQDGEGFYIGTQIIFLLRAAKIRALGNLASTVVSGGFTSGIEVRGPATEEDFVLALKGTLSSIGKLQVTANGSGTRPAAAMGGHASMGGMAGMGGGVIPFPAGPAPRGSPVTVFVGIKPVPVIQPK